MRFALVLFLIASVSGAQELETFEKILLPVLTPSAIEGANQSFFATQLAIFSPVRVQYFPKYDWSPDNMRIVTVGSLGAEEPPQFFFAASPPSRHGRLFYLDRALSNHVFFSLTLLSRIAADQRWNETGLPVVRERDFKTNTVYIPGIASRYVYVGGPACREAIPQFRHHLRIYNVDGRSEARVRIRFYQETGFPQPPFRELAVEVTQREGTDPSYPMFAQVTLDEICNPFSCHTPCAGGRQRVEIVPETPGLRFWAMVSATDNFTHQVSIAYPQ